MKSSPATSVLIGADNEIFIVDVSDDEKRVIITSPWQREEGTPESAMAFAKRLHDAHGDIVIEFCRAVKRAADKCLFTRANRKVWVS
jgi:ABC-type nitrate/sulfonate/bicarbonate transport system substrate-binding protein